MHGDTHATLKRQVPIARLTLVLLAHSHGLGQVARLVHVEPAQDGEVVGQQLQRHNVDDGLQTLYHLRHLHRMAGLDWLERMRLPGKLAIKRQT